MMREKEALPRRKPAYFWWALANLLALCLAVLSWVLCLQIFNHPEVPQNYEILRKLGRVEPPKPLKEMEAPPGESADPRALYVRYATLKKEEMDSLNSSLMRNYLTNLSEPRMIQYVEGEFKVDQVRPLSPKDLVPQGFAVRARAMIPPDEFSAPAPWPVVIEYIFPTSNAESVGWIHAGDQLSVKKFPNAAMVIHVSKLDGEDTPVLCLTVVPVVFGSYQVGPDQSIELEAPASLNPSSILPLFRNQEN